MLPCFVRPLLPPHVQVHLVPRGRDAPRDAPWGAPALASAQRAYTATLCEAFCPFWSNLILPPKMKLTLIILLHGFGKRLQVKMEL